jgi:flagellar operon protein
MTVNNNEISSFIANNVNKNKSARNNNKPASNAQEAGKSFQDVLLETVRRNKELASGLKTAHYVLNKPELTVSKHARQRAEQRNIDIDEALDRINGAVIKAAGKNLKSVLILSAEAAFIVSVDNNVVVTAMNGEDMRENVITNIDGTVII